MFSLIAGRGKTPQDVVRETVQEIREAYMLLEGRVYPSGGRVPGNVPANGFKYPTDPSVSPEVERCSTELMAQIRELKRYCERERLPVPDELLRVEADQRRICGKLADL